MARALKHYSDYVTGLAALVGVPFSTISGQPNRVSTEIGNAFNTLFDSAMSKIWGTAPWIDISPYGEARFLGNRLTYPNDITQTSVWTATAITATANSVQNPADGTTTASKMMETAATSAHKVVQAVTTFFPSTGYAISVYARPNGRSYIQIGVSDGVTTYTSFFDITTGATGTNSNFTSTSIAQQPNGFWLCRATFTANAAATTSGTYTVSISTDGSTTSYAGDTTKGIYIWGNLVQQTTNVPVNDANLAWDQTGENAIDVMFNAWASNPGAMNNPWPLTYEFNAQGIQFINATPYPASYTINGIVQSSQYGLAPSNPIWIHYRKAMPSWTGLTYDSTATYAVGGQVYFNNSSNNGDYYKCIVATTAGQSPDTTPTSWQVIPLYESLFQFVLYNAYAQWLMTDGQEDKAESMLAIAESKLADAADKQERQMGFVMVTKMQTHLSAATRWF